MIVLTYVLIFYAVVALNTVKSARLLPPAAQRLTNLQSSAQVKLCTAFGFRSHSGHYMYDSLFKSEAIPKDLIVFKAETDREILKLQGSGDVFVTHASALEKNSGARLLLKSISAYVRGLCRAGTSASALMVLVEGRESENTVLEKQILQIVDEAQSFKCDMQVIFRYSGSDAGFDSEQVEGIRDTLISKAVEASHKRKTPQSAAQVHNIVARATESPIVEDDQPRWQRQEQTKREEIVATVACKDLAEDYQARLNASIVDLLSSGLLHGGNTVNDTMDALELSVQGVTEAFQTDYHDLLSTHRDSKVVSEVLPEQCRTVTAELLLPVYRRIVQSMLLAMCDDFTERLRRLSLKTPDITQAMYETANRASISFSNSLRRIHDGFANMVDSTGGIVIKPSAPSAGAQHTRRRSELSQFDAAFEKYQLASFVRESVAERVRELGLNGVINPYIRTYPFPPLHVNVNYQIHPKDISFSREFSRMYDEPRAGPCENRAEPLLFNGVAQVPFDPSYHPLTPDRRTLLQKLKYIVTGRE